jgi:hypothetical protein
VSAGHGKNGKHFTLKFICEVSKNESIQQRRTLIKGDYQFADEVFDLYIKQTG